MKILVTGGAGFIGSAVIRHFIEHTDAEIINVDKLTYAGNLESLASVADHPRYHFEQQDICDLPALNEIFVRYTPDAVMHLAAESHVDRSIDDAASFIQTNVVGTFNLLEVSRRYWSTLSEQQQQAFRFHHVSTDEVFGELGSEGLFTEQSAYAPNSPYSASKASSDHLVRAWHRTYGLPVVISNCSNNYGPFHFPEKLIPLMILNAKEGKPLPVYGNGKQIRDWLFVEDHAKALALIIAQGKVGETYNIGGNNEKTNLEVVQTICDILDELLPQRPNGISSYRELITFVPDRPGHDQRYAIDASKISSTLGWLPKETFDSGIRKTVCWFLENQDWWQSILDGSYQLGRLGLGQK